METKKGWGQDKDQYYNSKINLSEFNICGVRTAHNNSGGFHCDSTENTVFETVGKKKEFNNLLERQCE